MLARSRGPGPGPRRRRSRRAARVGGRSGRGGAPSAREAGPGGKEGSRRRSPGLSSPRRPEDARSAREQVGDAGTKFLETRLPRAHSSPLRLGAPGPGRRQVPPARCPPPEPAGPVPARPGSRPAFFSAARLPASAGWPPRAPLLLSSARAGAGRAHARCAPPPSPWGGAVARGGGGASALGAGPRWLGAGAGPLRERRAAGARAADPGARGAAGGARAHCALRRGVRHPALSSLVPRQTSAQRTPAVSPSVSQHTTLLFPYLSVFLQTRFRRGPRDGELGYFVDVRELKARKRYKYKRCEDCS